MLKKLPIILLLIACMTVTSGAEDFYKSYPESERLLIADAYLSVSENYLKMGEKEKAATFRAIAQEVYPGIEVARESVEIVPSEGENAVPATLPAVAPVRPSGTEPAAVRYFFSKLMRGIFTENISSVMSLISTRLYLPGYDQGVSRDEVSSYLKVAFDNYPLEKTDPSLVYNFNRYYVKKEGSAWTVKVNLTEQGMKIMKEKLSFSGESHIFYFREYREGWRLIAINAE